MIHYGFAHEGVQDAVEELFTAWFVVAEVMERLAREFPNEMKELGLSTSNGRILRKNLLNLFETWRPETENGIEKPLLLEYR